jgi:hypothetical protein
MTRHQSHGTRFWAAWHPQAFGSVSLPRTSPVVPLSLRLPPSRAMLRKIAKQLRACSQRQLQSAAHMDMGSTRLAPGDFCLFNVQLACDLTSAGALREAEPGRWWAWDVNRLLQKRWRPRVGGARQPPTLPSGEWKSQATRSTEQTSCQSVGFARLGPSGRQSWSAVLRTKMGALLAGALPSVELRPARDRLLRGPSRLG